MRVWTVPFPKMTASARAFQLYVAHYQCMPTHMHMHMSAHMYTHISPFDAGIPNVVDFDLIRKVKNAIRRSVGHVARACGQGMWPGHVARACGQGMRPGHVACVCSVSTDLRDAAGRGMVRTLYIGSTSASPTACLLCEYRSAVGLNDRLGKSLPTMRSTFPTHAHTYVYTHVCTHANIHVYCLYTCLHTCLHTCCRPLRDGRA